MHIVFKSWYQNYQSLCKTFSADVSGTTSGYRNEMIIVYSNGGKKNRMISESSLEFELSLR